MKKKNIHSGQNVMTHSSRLANKRHTSAAQWDEHTHQPAVVHRRQASGCFQNARQERKMAGRRDGGEQRVPVMAVGRLHNQARLIRSTLHTCLKFR